MHEKFQMSFMGELTFFFGLQVKQKKDGIFISQDKYVAKILKKFRSMIGSLMYLTSSRPDIMFAVCACASYQANAKVSHLHAVKRIFSARNRQWLQIPQQKLSMWLLQVAADKCFGFRINYLIIVDGKKIIITESSVRRDLQLADEEGVDCLPNSTIFEQLTLMG
ncbi:hypothetical protein Tco_1453479, partial [Tanacetum coccineum]